MCLYEHGKNEIKKIEYTNSAPKEIGSNKQRKSDSRIKTRIAFLVHTQNHNATAIQICGDIKNSTLVQFVLGNHLHFVENGDIMVDV